MEELKNLSIQNVDLKFEINLDRYTTIKLGNIGNIAIVKSEEALQELLIYLIEKNIKYHLVGWGANQVLLNSVDTLFIKLDFIFDRTSITADEMKYELPASVPLNTLTTFAKKLGLSGWEVFTGIPGSLGGAICMNAGTSLGEIGDLIESIRILKPNGEIYTYACDESSFRYRNNNFLQKGEIIISAVIKHNGIDKELSQKISEYLEYREKTQPLKTKNCGSVFKNLDEFRAGIIIDSIGLKGFGTKNISVSLKHGNFIENSGDGTAQEFQDVINRLQDEIERLAGLKFELEVKVY